ncbi:MAG TPA: hypothetical protein ENI64_00390 [Gammaproteobacteria bacterium]|nr:hypothetical protein [Gammaproteobacteria bacterium]
MLVKDGKLQKRLVQTTGHVDDMIRISQGVTAGEYFVSRDVAALYDGQLVTMVQQKGRLEKAAD